jgi:hypothetical protein
MLTQNTSRGNFALQDYFILTGTTNQTSSGVRLFHKSSGVPAMAGILHNGHSNAYDVIAFADQHYSSMGAFCETVL